MKREMKQKRKNRHVTNIKASEKHQYADIKKAKEHVYIFLYI